MLKKKISRRPTKLEFMCVSVCCQSDEGVCVGLCGDVGELGVHSSVDLVGIKVKRNVSKL